MLTDENKKLAQQEAADWLKSEDRASTRAAFVERLKELGVDDAEETVAHLERMA